MARAAKGTLDFDHLFDMEMCSHVETIRTSSQVSMSVMLIQSTIAGTVASSQYRSHLNMSY